jgi:hypothetical protein
MFSSREGIFNNSGDGFDCHGDACTWFNRDPAYKLTVSDRFLINEQVDEFVEQYRHNKGESPDMTTPGVMAGFLPRIEQYGFELPVVYEICKKNLDYWKRELKENDGSK